MGGTDTGGGGTHSSVVDSLKLVIEQKRTYFLLTAPKSDLNTRIRQKGGHTLRGGQTRRGGGEQVVNWMYIYIRNLDPSFFRSK